LATAVHCPIRACAIPKAMMRPNSSEVLPTGSTAGAFMRSHLNVRLEMKLTLAHLSEHRI
jgi:hypothetical protein